MMQEMLAVGSGGGGGSVSGNTSTISKNSDYEIDTGLSDVNRFVFVGYISSSYATMISFDKDDAVGKYNSANIGATQTSRNANFGSYAQHINGIKSISGGKVTIHTYNSSYGDIASGIWFAE